MGLYLLIAGSLGALALAAWWVAAVLRSWALAGVWAAVWVLGAAGAAVRGATAGPAGGAAPRRVCVWE